MITPYARVNFVDHGVTDQTSIIRFVARSKRLLNLKVRLDQFGWPPSETVSSETVYCVEGRPQPQEAVPWWILFNRTLDFLWICSYAFLAVFDGLPDMAAPRGGTSERILDAAEELFAIRGYEGTSTRAIVAKSGDTIGSVNYHFGSKEKLLREVVKRRFELIADARRERYRQASSAALGGKPGLQAVVEAIILPYLERAMRGGPGWLSYTHLIGALLYSPRIYHKIMAKLTEPTAREFIGWITDALPAADPKDIAYAYEFMIGSMVECCAEISVDRVRTITDGLCSSADYDAVSGRLVRFITAGIEAVVRHGNQQKAMTKAR